MRWRRWGSHGGQQLPEQVDPFVFAWDMALAEAGCEQQVAAEAQRLAQQADGGGADGGIEQTRVLALLYEALNWSASSSTYV